MALKASELSTGQTFTAVVVEDLKRTQIVQYAGASGDYNPLHTDEVFATKVAGYPSVFAHGMLTMGMTGRMVTDLVGDGRLTTFGGRFTSQVFPGDDLTTTATVAAVTESDGAPVVELTVRTVNQDDREVFSGYATGARRSVTRIARLGSAASPGPRRCSSSRVRAVRLRMTRTPHGWREQFVCEEDGSPEDVGARTVANAAGRCARARDNVDACRVRERRRCARIAFGRCGPRRRRHGRRYRCQRRLHREAVTSGRSRQWSRRRREHDRGRSPATTPCAWW